MKFQICAALMMCLVLSGCGRCWNEVCTHSCESWAEENGTDAGHCLTDVTDSDVSEEDGVVEIGDITVEDTTSDVVEDVETEEPRDVSDDVETSDL